MWRRNKVTFFLFVRLPRGPPRRHQRNSEKRAELGDTVLIRALVHEHTRRSRVARLVVIKSANGSAENNVDDFRADISVPMEVSVSSEILNLIN